MSEEKKRLKIAVIHPRLGFGGSETGAMWSTEALKNDHDVTLITGGKIDLERLNAYYGTDLRPGELRVLEVPLLFGLHRHRILAGLHGALFLRACRRIAKSFDVVTWHYNPCDFGVLSIQFVADFSFAPALQHKLDPASLSVRSWWYDDTLLRKAYLGICHSLAPSHPENWKKNVTVANSRWTADILKREFGLIADRVQFPPVPGDFPIVRWEEKDPGFVCVGSIFPEKRMDAVIGILERVRERGYDLHLHILGGLDDSPFAKKIQVLAEQRRNWVFLEGRVVGAKKRELMAQHKFGINGRQNEPFGIAVAELVRAGCITFVPDGGGQTEITNHPSLVFANDDDAVEKIVSVLENQGLQESLVEHLRARREELSTEGFQKMIRTLVAEFNT